MRDILTCSLEHLASYLYTRRNALCTMCSKKMPEGFCADSNCPTYPPLGLGVRFVRRFRRAIHTAREKFIKPSDPTIKRSLVVSGGRVESKRRKH